MTAPAIARLRFLYMKQMVRVMEAKPIAAATKLSPSTSPGVSSAPVGKICG